MVAVISTLNSLQNKKVQNTKHIKKKELWARGIVDEGEKEDLQELTGSAALAM